MLGEGVNVNCMPVYTLTPCVDTAFLFHKIKFLSYLSNHCNSIMRKEKQNDSTHALCIFKVQT